MTVNLLVTDHWVGRLNDLQYNDSANWDTIEAAIRRLDGRQYTEASIEKIEEESDANEGEVCLSVGGGPQRFLVIFRAQDGSEFLSAQGEPAAGTIELVIGGQSADFPTNVTVDLESALELARHFADQSEPIVPSGWEKHS